MCIGDILDGVLIANECIHSRHKENVAGLICQINLEKGYDRGDWNFLSYLMSRMGFGGKWRRRIHERVSTTYFSFLSNGTLKGFFPAHRGIRQGDPLSLFLFAMVGDALSCMLSVAGEANLISGFDQQEHLI